MIIENGEIVDIASFICHDGKKVYVELTSKKTLGGFLDAVPILVPQDGFPIEINVEIEISNPIAQEDIVKQKGSPMKKGKAPAALTPADHYSCIRLTGLAPPAQDEYTPMTEVKKRNDAVSAANAFNAKEEEITIVLRPWQSIVVDFLKHQKDRKCLWVCCRDGGSGKSVLLKYLEQEYNFQLMAGSSSHHTASSINPAVAGYAIDIPRYGTPGASTTLLTGPSSSQRITSIRRTTSPH